MKTEWLKMRWASALFLGYSSLSAFFSLVTLIKRIVIKRSLYPRFHYQVPTASFVYHETMIQTGITCRKIPL